MVWAAGWLGVDRNKNGIMEGSGQNNQSGMPFPKVIDQARPIAYSLERNLPSRPEYIRYV